MKKLVLIMGITLLMIISINSTSFAKFVINTDTANQGIITVKTTNEIKKNIKVRLVNGKNMVTYDLTESNKDVPFALTLGNGSYEVKIYEQYSGNTYALLETRDAKKTFTATLDDEKAVYLYSTNEVNWNEEQSYIKLAKELTQNAQTDEEKVEIVYNYLVNNFTYDYIKAYSMKSDYKPNLETLFSQKKGVCYDYSAIFAGMLRSLNIPTKLVKGYLVTDQSTYHAWNEVLVNGEWKSIDTTNDSYKIQHNIATDMYKLSSNFIVDCYN